MKKRISNNNLSEDNLAEQVTNLPSTQNEAIAEIIKGLYQGKPLLGKGGLLTNLVKDLTQLALQGEMDSHLAEETLEQGGNRRNGITTKTMRTGGSVASINQVLQSKKNTFIIIAKNKKNVLSYISAAIAF